MLAKLKNAFSKNKEKASALIVAPLAAATVGLTSSGWVITFEQADKDAIGEGFTNALSNLWAGFTAVLPYIGMAVWVILVIGLAFKLIFKRG